MPTLLPVVYRSLLAVCIAFLPGFAAASPVGPPTEALPNPSPASEALPNPSPASESEGFAAGGTLLEFPPRAGAIDPSALPNTPAGDKMRAILGLLEAPRRAGSDEEIIDHLIDDFFAPSFVAERQRQEIWGRYTAVLRVYAETKGLDLYRVDAQSATEIGILGRGRRDNNWWRIVVQTAPADSPDAGGVLGFQTIPEGQSPLSSADLLLRNLRTEARSLDSAPGCSLVIYSVDSTDGSLSPHLSFRPNASLSVDACASLWALTALAAHVESGAAEWTDKVTVRDALLAAPRGLLDRIAPDSRKIAEGTIGLRDFSDGETLSLRTLATRTAAGDHGALMHVFDLVGTAAVTSASLRQAPQGAPDTPLLTPRQLLRMKAGVDHAAPSGALQRYISAAPSARADLISSGIAKDTTPDRYAPSRLVGWEKPLGIGTIGYTATARQLCEGLVALHLQGLGNEHYAAANDAMRNDAIYADPLSPWSSVGYIGGAEPGVLAQAALLERADGRLFAVAALYNNPDKPLDEARCASVFRRACGLVLLLD